MAWAHKSHSNKDLLGFAAGPVSQELAGERGLVDFRQMLGLVPELPAHLMLVWVHLPLLVLVLTDLEMVRR